MAVPASLYAKPDDSSARYRAVEEKEGAPRMVMRICQRGHELKPENTYVSPNGQRTCRTCKHAYDREYRQRNREKLKAYKREYYQRNSEKRKAYACEYRQQKAEKIKAYNHAYYQRTLEKHAVYRRAYYQRNLEKLKAYSRAYYKQHRE